MMKKALSLVLSMVMLLGLAVPAGAVETGSHSQSVTATYSPTGADIPGGDDAPTITGIELSGSSVSEDEYDDYNILEEFGGSITVTVTGTNLSEDMSDDYLIDLADGEAAVKINEMEISEDGTSASYEVDYIYFIACWNYELSYSTDGGYSWTPFGPVVYYMLDEGPGEIPETVTVKLKALDEEGNEIEDEVSARINGWLIDNTDDWSVDFWLDEQAEMTDWSVPNGYVTPGNGDISVSYTSEEWTLAAESEDFEVGVEVEDGYRYVISVVLPYDEPVLDPAFITGVAIKVGDTLYEEGNVTLTPDSGDVTIIVSVDDVYALTGDYCVWYAAGHCDHNIAEWDVDEKAGTVFCVLSSEGFEACTEAFEIMYSNGGCVDNVEDYIGTGLYVIYQEEAVSLDITWGSMNFTYTDGEDGAEGAWSCDEDANKITVTCSGEGVFMAQVFYNAAEDYAEISGNFEDENGVANETSSVEDGFDAVFYLILDGKPAQALDDVVIGTVTILISEYTDDFIPV